MQIDNFERWVGETKFRIMRPNTMNKYGAVLDDFGLDTMLDKLMEGVIRPISKGNIFLNPLHSLLLESLFNMFTVLKLKSYFESFVLQYSSVMWVEQLWTLTMVLLLNMGKIGMLI